MSRLDEIREQSEELYQRSSSGGNAVFLSLMAGDLFWLLEVVEKLKLALATAKSVAFEEAKQEEATALTVLHAVGLVIDAAQEQE